MVYYKGNFNTKKREMQCCTTGEFTTVCTAFWFKSIPRYAIICQDKVRGNMSRSLENTEKTKLYQLIRGYAIMIKVLFICHGNICRSTMAQSVFTHMVKQKGIEDVFEIDSAATSREEIGNGPHYGTVRKLQQVGIPVIPHHARQMTKKDYEYYDYLIGMDTANIRNMNTIAGGDKNGKIYKMLSFAGSGRDVADPWYTGDFDATYRDVVEGLEAFLEKIMAEA